MASKREPWPLIYGGWNSYREWADNGFLPREIVEEDEKDAEQKDTGGGSASGKGGGRRRGKHTGTGAPDGREEPAPERTALPAAPAAPALPPAAARGSSGHFAAPVPAESGASYPPAPVVPPPGDRPAPFARPPEPEGPPPAALRPYVMTAGRTRPRRDLAIEALVSTTAHGHAVANRQLPEHRAICLLCRTTCSVAEVAAALDVPLGVARVLIDDLAHQGLVVVHGVREGGVTQQLLERVLDGLRRL